MLVRTLARKHFFLTVNVLSLKNRVFDFEYSNQNGRSTNCQVFFFGLTSLHDCVAFSVVKSADSTFRSVIVMSTG